MHLVASKWKPFGKGISSFKNLEQPKCVASLCSVQGWPLLRYLLQEEPRALRCLPQRLRNMQMWSIECKKKNLSFLMALLLDLLHVFLIRMHSPHPRLATFTSLSWFLKCGASFSFQENAASGLTWSVCQPVTWHIEDYIRNNEGWNELYTS